MFMKREAHILTLLVDNEFGVLTRITAQIRREGWNIKSLAVAESMDPAVSRITLALECYDTTLPEVMHRLSRLACVRSVTAYHPEQYVCRELAIVRVLAEGPAVEETAQRFGARTLTRQAGVTLLELTAEPAELNEFLLALRNLADVSVARTGAITLER